MNKMPAGTHPHCACAVQPEMSQALDGNQATEGNIAGEARRLVAEQYFPDLGVDAVRPDDDVGFRACAVGEMSFDPL